MLEKIKKMKEEKRKKILQEIHDNKLNKQNLEIQAKEEKYKALAEQGKLDEEKNKVLRFNILCEEYIKNTDHELNKILLEKMYMLFENSLICDDQFKESQRDNLKDYFYKEMSNKFNLSESMESQLSKAHPSLILLSEEITNISKKRKGGINKIRNSKLKQEKKEEYLEKLLVMSEDEAKNNLNKKADLINIDTGSDKLKSTICDYIENEQKAQKEESEKIINIKNQIKEIVDKKNNLDEDNKEELSEKMLINEKKIKIGNKYKTQFNKLLNETANVIVNNTGKENNILSEGYHFNNKGLDMEKILLEATTILTMKEYCNLFNI